MARMFSILFRRNWYFWHKWPTNNLSYFRTKKPEKQMKTCAFAAYLSPIYCITTQFLLVGCPPKNMSYYSNIRQTDAKCFFFSGNTTNEHTAKWMMIMIIEIIVINKHKCIRIDILSSRLLLCLSNTHLSWINIWTKMKSGSVCALLNNLLIVCCEFCYIK